MVRRLHLALALTVAFALAACDTGALLPANPASDALRVAGNAHLGVDAAGRPRVTAPDGNARLELPVTAERADLLFRAVPADGAPLTLEWSGGPRLVRLSSWAANGHHDLRLDLRRAGAGPAMLRVLDGDRSVAEVPVPTGVDVPIGPSVREPTSIHIWVDENGRKTIVFDYDLAPGGSTNLSSDLLGLREAPITHVAVTLPPAERASEDHGGELLAVEGAREVTVFDARTP